MNIHQKFDTEFQHGNRNSDHVQLCNKRATPESPRSATFKPFAMSLSLGRSHVKAEEQRARCVNKRQWAHRHGPTVLVRQHGSNLFDEPEEARTQAKREDNNMVLPACGVT